MKKKDPLQNYQQTLKQIGYVPLKKAGQKDYDRIGFMSGLEVHQQLRTKEKLFCHCPAGIYHQNSEYDAELIRHMRPTLSELGEYDGTALMEFKTRKEIIYQINNQTACTYEVDDTPPFKIDREALEYAIEISLASKLNIVGEVHITRKQYLDGSIPTGFQRTAIIGVNGEIQLKNKIVRLIQLSIEEDSCREISDIGHQRVYKTDRLGMPLIETVTYPDMVNPQEVMEACNYIRFLNRSTNRVRTGIGTGRQDVNVSCRGGSRVEIKGVAHTKWIPELTHNEAFRQWALLNIRDSLLKQVPKPEEWVMQHTRIDMRDLSFNCPTNKYLQKFKTRAIAINLPGFKNVLSHFTQPGKCFANELSDRLKVIACIEKPNMVTTEDLNFTMKDSDHQFLKKLFDAKEYDAQLILWSPPDDIDTALETIEERCRIAFKEIPKETRKSFPDGTTIFERVLPGADRMYPDTDSPPIPLEDEYIEELKKRIPQEVSERYKQMKKWGIPEDTYFYILRNNLFPLIERIIQEFGYSPVFVGTFFGHTLKYQQGQKEWHPDFSFEKVYGLFKYLHKNGLHENLAAVMLPMVYQYPKMDFESILTSIKFRKRSKEELVAPVNYLLEKFKEIKTSPKEEVTVHWIMGQLHKQAIGNTSLGELRKMIEEKLKEI
jgi:glutamyl-tRNA(Gln) amidotransferase subunit E